ncbi:DNA-binding Lrp family transcriptional regulator [Paeniglutamicibacter cryotolerans]|uniref:DNA-binding Lrp family transcriptional regulator n=2 Tax=Paeniglutamicibacter cryotolerans TaxID=670079 RepID=A0A839QIW2_9MICC|nr:DNA-binding Lrp family transcriptional regulator [Paeniglutamicibacter cryotolerans]
MRSMHQIDDTDRRILQALATTPKATAVALAHDLHLSRNTVQARLAALESADALLPFERRINPATLGYPLTAFVHIHVRQRQLADIVEALSQIPELIEAHGLTGSADILARVVADGAQELFRVNGRILAIDGVERADTSLSMAELIPHRMLPLLRHGWERQAP